MSASSRTVEPLSEFRVEKSQARATLTLSNGTLVRGRFFVDRHSRTHEGPEGIRDVLNAETGFFPFEAESRGGAETILLNRDHLVYVELADASEARRDPGYAVATERLVVMLLSNGVRMRGTVRVYRPQGRDRLSDFARSQEAFRYLETANTAYVVNVRHIVELAEEAAAP